VASILRSGGPRPLAVAVGVLLLATQTGCDQTPGAGPEPASTLASCPDLRVGQRDPVNGMNCVSWLQRALGWHGHPGQPVTGAFAGVTEANVRAFQRAQGIRPVNGVAGPRTRGALTGALRLGGVGPGPARPGGARPSPLAANAFVSVGCQGGSCALYLSRATTASLGGWVARHPISVGFTFTLVVNGTCGALRRFGGAFICGYVGGNATARVITQLGVAARQNACLRIALTRPRPQTRFRLLDVSPTQSRQCA
jgi:peptidoglycan hydrolase-like protein with peptidoglycan-binding domain